LPCLARNELIIIHLLVALRLTLHEQFFVDQAKHMAQLIF